MAVAEDDLRLWHAWKADKSMDNLHKLLRQMDPVVQQFVGRYRHAGIPRAALETEAKLNVVKGFHSYDPGHGTQLSTHVTNWLQKTQRLVHENKGLTRVPEHRALKAATFVRVRDHLRVKLDRDPTTAEMQEELMASHPVSKEHEAESWSSSEVGRMEKELRKTMLSSKDTLQETIGQESSRTGKILDWAYYELAPQEQAVFEHLTGRGGKPRLDGEGIAKALSLSPSKVSRIRQRIVDKIRRFSDSPGVV